MVGSVHCISLNFILLCCTVGSVHCIINTWMGGCCAFGELLVLMVQCEQAYMWEIYGVYLHMYVVIEVLVYFLI